MMHYVRLAGIDDKGITDPLNFETENADPIREGQILMDAVGSKYGIDEVRNAPVISLATRRRPLVTSG
jgi:hypothetical protein